MTDTENETVTQAEEMWLDIAVSNRGECYILDYSPFFKGWDIQPYWEDTFDKAKPILDPGAYRFSGFTLGRYDDDEPINLEGGDFTQVAPKEATAEIARLRSQMTIISALVQGLHAQVFGVHSLHDPEFSHQALSDNGQLHEAVHALIEALPSRCGDSA